MTDPGAVARCDWALKVPLEDQWRRRVGPLTEELFPDRRDKMLAYWIEKSETDEWTFDQLSDLAAALIEAGEDLPSPLSAFTVAVLRRKREAPCRTGPKGDRTRDFYIAVMVGLLGNSMSERAAKRLLASILHKSEEAIESMRRRGRSV